VRERLIIVGVLAGLALLTGVVFVAFQFGRVDPSPPSLEDTPDRRIPGEILFQSRDGCLTRAYASGDAREELCLPSVVYLEPFAWRELHAIETWNRGEYIRIDLATLTSERVPGVWRQLYPQRPPISANGETAVTENGGDITIVSDTGRETIASFDVGDRWVQPLLWSPDGEWLLVEWYPRSSNGSELWVVSRDGSIQGTLATGVRGTWVGWWIDGVGGSPSREDITQ
jgi:hypothetical protein